MLRIQVPLVLLLASVTSSDVPTTVKTVQQGATVNEPVLNVSTLDEDGQLMAYYGGKLSAQYFCNGTCHNNLDSVCQFQVYSGHLCLIIPNANVSNSGEYKIVLNGHEDVLNLILTVEAAPQHPQHSLLIWLVPVIGVSAAVLFLVIRLNYKKLGFQRTTTTSI